MNPFFLIPAFAVPAITGYVFMSWLLARDERATVGERFFFGLGAGAGMLSFVMLLIGFAGIRYGAFSITAVMLAVCAFFAWLSSRSVGLKKALFSGGGVGGGGGVSSWKKCAVAVILIWMSLKFSFVAYEGFTRPIFAWDAWVNWSAGAKAFYYDGGLMLRASGEEFFGGVYRPFLGHPVHLPLLQVWSAVWLGGFHEAYVKVWSVLYYAALLGVIYVAVRREAGGFYALAAAFFFSIAPLPVFHAVDAYADLQLGYYVLCSSVFLWRYVDGGKRASLTACSFFVAMGLLTKNEGIIFAAAAVFALLLRAVIERRGLEKNGLRDAALGFLPAIVILTLPWFAFKFSHSFGFGHTGSGLKWLSDPKFGEGAGGSIHWEVLVPALREFFLRANFGLIFPFWFFASVAAIKTVIKTNVRYLYAYLVFAIASYIFIYLTLEVTAVTEVTGINRNMLAYAPATLFVCAVLVKRAFSGTDNPVL